MSQKFYTSVRDSKVLFGKFCVGVRDLRCNPKSSVAQKNTHGYGYHIELELCDRSRD